MLGLILSENKGMIKIELRCLLKGNDFSADKIVEETGVIFNSVREYNFKKDSPFKRFRKVATILPKENGIYDVDDNKLINKFSSFIKDKVASINASGCEKIVLAMDVWHDDQCNMSFFNSTFKAISESFDDIDISCYEDDEGRI